MAARTDATAADVRAWAATPEGTAALAAAEARTPGSRGRLHPSTVTVFQKENPTKRYREKVAEGNKTPLDIPHVDTIGRVRLRSTDVPNEVIREVGSMLGVAKADSNGRFSNEAKAQVAAALIVTK